MAIAHLTTLTLTKGGVTVSSTQTTQSQEGAFEADFLLAANQTNFPVPSAVVTRANIKSMLLVFDQAVTLKTNSSGVPIETWAFAPNVPLYWDAAMPTACPFSVDLTAIFLTNTAAANCKIYILTNIV